MLGLYLIAWTGCAFTMRNGTIFENQFRTLVDNAIRASRALDNKQIVTSDEEEAQNISLLAENAGYDVYLTDL